MNNNLLSILLIVCLLSVFFACNSSTSTGDKETPTTSKTTDSAKNTSKTPKNPVANAATIEDKLKVIRSLYKEIQDNLEEYPPKNKSYNSEFESPVVGELVAYQKNGEIVKLVDKSEEDHGPGQNEYFFVNGELFFLFSQINTVEMTEKPDTHVRELRLYFDEGKIIDALVKTKTFKDGETIDMSIVANEKGTTLIDSVEEAKYYTDLASETLEFFQSKESFDEFYGNE